MKTSARGQNGMWKGCPHTFGHVVHICDVFPAILLGFTLLLQPTHSVLGYKIACTQKINLPLFQHYIQKQVPDGVI